MYVPNTTAGRYGRPVIYVCAHNRDELDESLTAADIPCTEPARYAVHVEGFNDALRCGNHLADAVAEAIGLSHNVASAEVFVIGPRPDRDYPDPNHPHSGYEIERLRRD